MEHIFRISDGRGRHKTYAHRFYLWSHGFAFDKEDQSWTKTLDSSRAKEYIRFAEKKKLKYEFVSKNTHRSSNYKKKWTEANPSWHGMYLCTYCGWIVPADKITVDHIVPIQAAKRSLKFEQSGRNVNDLENLCGSCMKCNRNKSDKQGLWVVRGRLFRKPFLRRLRFAIRMVLLAVLINLAIYYFVECNGAETVLQFAEEFGRIINNILSGFLK